MSKRGRTDSQMVSAGCSAELRNLDFSFRVWLAKAGRHPARPSKWHVAMRHEAERQYAERQTAELFGLL